VGPFGRQPNLCRVVGLLVESLHLQVLFMLAATTFLFDLLAFVGR
jgi:hypothetical protein